MSDPIHRVLFLCTGNSARSILAEAIVNHVASHDGRFRAYSAGSFPKAQPNPDALALLRRQHIPTEGLSSKPWDVFAEPGAPPIDFVFTVCDQAAGEVCPIWPGKPLTAHWGIPDPAAVEGSDATRQGAFLDAFVALKRRIELFTSLPIASLDRLTLQQRMHDIGTQ
ncbi:MAG: arsenate reductase ArsC [Dokdonella sp.]|uniref:arsenate reductase ArsC n=1 Tax=Dokdonella sp. TaxID=2291710 RepID=UPI00326721EF